jgi:predicted PurR-regulated permease PerM
MNVLQTIVCTKITSDQLSIHPIVNLSSTLVGAALGGIIGAVLATPLVATAIRIRGLIAQGRPPAQAIDPHPGGVDARAVEAGR